MRKFTSLDEIPSAEQFKKELNRRRYKKVFAATLKNTFASFLVAAAVAVLICYLVLPVIRVTGSGMEPTLYSDQIILCSKLRKAERGDIIALYYNKKLLLKRVIAVAGDVIDIDEDGTVKLNGAVLDEPYIVKNALGECDVDFPYTVKQNRWFVMGDNRAASVDSRYAAFGCVSDENILGVVQFRIYPFDLPHKLESADE